MFHSGEVQRPVRARPASTGGITAVCSFGASGAGTTPCASGADVAPATASAGAAFGSTGAGAVATEPVDAEGAGVTGTIVGSVAGVPATSQPLINELFVTHTGVYKGTNLSKVFLVAS